MKYDKEKIYDEQISPLMTKIIEICQANDIQMLMSFYLKEKTASDDDMYCTSCLIPNKGSKYLLDAQRVIMENYTVQKPFFMAMTVTGEGNN